ncbi:MAG: peptidoglycan recognition family protein [Verrucomicrobiae bacterium]|nr:peptidoglycan recognition family protein [Verrucomicrobiae bacterium]
MKKHLFIILVLLSSQSCWIPAGHASPRPPPPVYKEPAPAPTPVKMRNWRYISVHHTGSSAGNETVIQEDHLRKGMENGMAYHFLIGNGTMRLGDGVIVEGRRWKFQLQGGHSHQEYLNEYGIGICLVGNFNRKVPTARQIATLARLVCELQAFFQIPDENIHGHGQFYGEDSDCPGKLFPWTTFSFQMNIIQKIRGTTIPPPHLKLVSQPAPR